MSLAIDIASWVSLVLGSIFCVISGIGLLRLPDFYTRTHAAGIADSLGAFLLLFGMALQSGFSLVTVKLLTIWVFLWLTSPAATHAVAKAAFARGLRVLGEPVESRQLDAD